jgi:NAD(P)H-dependent flavin oxidoreductase YrpB (nitropropane dioxygenase family)
MELPPLKIGHLVSKLPIIQGGMGVGISLSGLASAVANEGGIGVIATIMIGINEPCITTYGAQAQIGALKREIRKAKDLTRGIRNEFIECINNGEKRPLKCPYHCIKTCDLEKSPYCIALALECARRGKFKNGFAFAGQNAYRVNEIVSVKELINSLKAEYSLTMHNSIASKSLIRHF